MISGDEVIGPIPVPAKPARACKVGWDVGGVVTRTSEGWRLVEVLEHPAMKVAANDERRRGMARKRSTARADQPRPSQAVRLLRDALGLDEVDWQVFLWHARDGFADFEQAHSTVPVTTLRLRDIPDDWFADLEALGYIVMRVLHEGEAALATPVARYFLRVCDPEPGSFHCPPGVGLAWLHLAREGVAPPVEPGRLAHLALHMPSEVFHGVTEDDLLPLSRLILEGRGTVEARDCTPSRRRRTRRDLRPRSPFRLFDDLLAAEPIAPAVKREFCRGLLRVHPKPTAYANAGSRSWPPFCADPDRMLQTPITWLELCRGGLG